MSGGSPVLAAAGLVKAYEGRLVLDGCDLELAAGGSLAVTGPSGCGKSTLLHCLVGLERPEAGVIRLAGEELGRLDDEGRCRLRARTVGLVFQDHHLLPEATVLENALLPRLALAERVDAAGLAQARALLAAVGLADRERAWPGQLSGGERQRLAVARALVNRPALVLADEPTGALDRRQAEAVADLLIRLCREQGGALLCVSHDLALAARLDRELRLEDGRLQPVARSCEGVRPKQAL